MPNRAAPVGGPLNGRKRARLPRLPARETTRARDYPDYPQITQITRARDYPLEGGLIPGAHLIRARAKVGKHSGRFGAVAFQAIAWTTGGAGNRDADDLVKSLAACPAVRSRLRLELSVALARERFGARSPPA